jgi:flavin reductase (DIM6/NTAB) family NADH-FMN oxidoreductase RutF
MIDIVADAITAAQAYKLLVGIVVPRPIAWISTLNEDGGVNLAPFSCYTFVSNDPPMVAISCGRREGVPPGTLPAALPGAPKDTARNAGRSGEFVVNVVGEDLALPMHRTSAASPAETSEAVLHDIELAPSRLVGPPRVAAAPIALECRVHRIVELGNLKSQLLIGEVVCFRIAEALYREGRIDTGRLRPLARLGGPHYAGLGPILTLPVVGDYGPAERPADSGFDAATR